MPLETTCPISTPRRVPPLRTTVAVLLLAAATTACGDGWMSVGGSSTHSVPATPNSDTDGPSSSNDGSDDAEDGDTGPSTMEEASDELGYSPEPGRLRRLTKYQIENTLAAVFGPRLDVADQLPADEAVERFLSMGASKVGTSSRGAQQYRDAALHIAETILADHRERVSALDECRPETTDAPCIGETVETLGTRLWRRPMTDREVDRYASLVKNAGDEHVDLGLRYAIAGLLQSPHFLYIVQPGEPAPDSRLYKFDDYEIASRLSYFLWNHPPDEQLRRAARNGELRTADQIQAQTRRMLDDDRARNLAYRFFSQAWNIDELGVGLRSSDNYPAWSDQLVESMRRELRLVLEEIVVERDADIREVFSADFTYVDSHLADLYGLEAGDEQGFRRVSHPDERTGLLTSGAVIASHSNSKHFLPVHRGVFVLRRILCTEPPPPTDEAEEAAQETVEDVEQSDEKKTPRQIMAEHASEPSCANCHEMFDPMGFTFANFDRVGKYRETYGGKPIDSTGSYNGEDFQDVSDLADYLREDPRTGRCIARNLFQFATGQELDPEDRELVTRLADHLRSDDHSFRELVVDVTTSQPFRFAAPPAYQGVE